MHCTGLASGTPPRSLAPFALARILSTKGFAEEEE